MFHLKGALTDKVLVALIPIAFFLVFVILPTRSSKDERSPPPPPPPPKFNNKKMTDGDVQVDMVTLGILLGGFSTMGVVGWYYYRRK